MGQKTMKKQFLSIAIIVSMIFTGCTTVFASELKDMKGHWAQSSIQSWADQGLISGYNDGTFKPNGSIVRSEFIALINRSFGFTEVKDVEFTDVKKTNWFYADLAKAVAAGYVKDITDGTFQPSQKVTRQEAASILTKLLSLAPSHSADQWADVTKLSDAAKGSIGAVVDAKLMHQNAKGKFRPDDNLSRAEAIVVLTRALQYKKDQTEVVYDRPGVFGPATGVETVKKNVRIVSPGVTLQNMNIEGDLTIEESVGDGEVFLKQVSVKGTTAVNGGGANSVHFENSVIVKIVVNKKDGSVRIVVEGTSEVKDVILQSGAKLEESNSSGAGFQNVTLAETLPADSKVTLSGQFETVDVLAAKIRVEIPMGQIDNLNVDQKAGDVSVDIGKEASIVELVLAAVAKVIGQGVIETAKITANGATIEQTPNKVEVGQDMKAEVGGKPAVNNGGTTGGSTSGGSSGGGDSPSSVNKTNLLSAISVAQATYGQAVEGNEIGQYRFGSKAEFLVGIQAAKSVYDNSSATQEQVNAALTTLNFKVMIFGYSKNQFSINELFVNLFNSSKVLYNSVVEGAGPGQAGAGTKPVFGEAIATARAVKNNSAASPQEIGSAYDSLSAAYGVFINAFTPNDVTKLQDAFNKVDQALVNAVEGVLPGQYRMGAIAILHMETDGSRFLLSNSHGPQSRIDSQVEWIISALNTFESDKVSENPAIIAPVDPYGKYTFPQNNEEFFKFTASVTGSVYVVPYSSFPTTINDLDSLTIKAQISVTNSAPTQINVSSLPIGKYKFYHVDAQGILSKAFIGYSIYADSQLNEVVVTNDQSPNTAGGIVNTVTWTDSTSLGVNSYSVYRGLTNNVIEMTELVQDIAPKTQVYVDEDPDLMPNTTYYYRIVIRNKSGSGVFSQGFSIQIPAGY